MKLPAEIREQFRRHGRRGGLSRAASMDGPTRRSVARRAGTARWIRARFGASSFAALGLPGGDLVDAGLDDLAAGETTLASLAVSLAAARLRREGVPIGAIEDDPEDRLYALLSQRAADLAHARYGAHLRQLASFADACRAARVDGGRRAP
jgi:hypothetical protein